MVNWIFGLSSWITDLLLTLATSGQFDDDILDPRQKIAQVTFKKKSNFPQSEMTRFDFVTFDQYFAYKYCGWVPISGQMERPSQYVYHCQKTTTSQGTFPPASELCDQASFKKKHMSRQFQQLKFAMDNFDTEEEDFQSKIQSSLACYEMKECD